MYKKCFDNLQQQEIDTALRIRIKAMPDKKLADFNFNVMHNILICGHYFSKWRDSVNENCEICDTVHDILHVLFDCAQSQYNWKKTEKALNYEFNKYKINIIYESRNMIPINYMKTIISYVILLCFYRSIVIRSLHSLYFLCMFVLYVCLFCIEYINKKTNNLID